MTDSQKSWVLLRVSQGSVPGEGKPLSTDTDRKDLAGRARALNAQQRKTKFYKKYGEPVFKFKVVPVTQY